MNVDALPTLETAQKLGLTEDEYERVTAFLGRKPNFTELSVYAVMWSEHCSYKNSIRWLKTLPNSGGRLLAAAGEENAGLVDIGDGLACAFKIESHNHPSAIEPFQGAATGVGGIHRDIFTVGARPMATLDSLRFGDPAHPNTRRLEEGVVRGISSYGNSFGVPTVGGETYYDRCYNINPLVNAMSIGVVEVGQTVSAGAPGPGNPVYIVGAATGKDGIHGATFASEDINEASEGKLPSVQVGDPFTEKLLLEATLEVIATGAVAGMQDMGAAGITCSTSEMAARTGTGMRIELDRVHTRQAQMKGWEILLSESQERMLVVALKGREHEVEAVFARWDLPCHRIGEVTDDGMMAYFTDGECVAHIPADSLVLGGGAPQYRRDYQEPPYFKAYQAFQQEGVAEPDAAELADYARRLLLLPNLAPKDAITEQYDRMVRTNTLSEMTPSDAAVVRLKGTRRGLCASTDCNSTYVYADPYRGAMMAVAEAARNVICAGGQPVAVTNCLNFGNPYDPHVYWQFVRAIEGMGEACRRLETPVTGGNVSFYNNSPEGGPVNPTPVIGMLGILDDVGTHTPQGFQQPGDAVVLLGRSYNELASSQYLLHLRQVNASPAPSFDMAEELALQRSLREAILRGWIRSAHDVSEGGLFVCLEEAAHVRGLGCALSAGVPEGFRADAWWFGEAGSRVVVSLPQAHLDQLETLARENELPMMVLGTVVEEHQALL
jgi:phosphoribosylformylglycinamidine synthase